MKNISSSKISIISIWVGILIPIIAASIPYTIPLIFPENSLSFKVSDLINIKGGDIFTITIRNDGKELEKNVTLSIKRSPAHYALVERLKKVKTVKATKSYLITHEPQPF